MQKENQIVSTDQTTNDLQKKNWHIQDQLIEIAGNPLGKKRTRQKS